MDKLELEDLGFGSKAAEENVLDETDEKLL